jgi:hypothetical protein
MLFFKELSLFVAETFDAKLCKVILFTVLPREQSILPVYKTEQMEKT